MSGFSSIGNVGHIPTSGSGKNIITPESLFRSAEEKNAYSKLVGRSAGSIPAQDIKVGKVKVEIFDLSDASQREEYEALWKDLLEKASRSEVLVESRKDLVQRADGTSYWMKYVEYVELGPQEEAEDKLEGSTNER